MAEQWTKIIVSDVSGLPATCRWVLGATDDPRVIDLTDDEARQLADLLGRWWAATRPLSAAGAPPVADAEPVPVAVADEVPVAEVAPVADSATVTTLDTGKPRRKPRAPGAPDPVDVRRWAVAQGISMTTTGRIPHAVQRQYLAAQLEAQGLEA